MLDGRREAEQPECVRDRRTALADAVGYLFVRQLEVVDQLLESGRFLQGGQILSMQVLDQRLLDDCKIIGAPNQGRNRRQTGAAGGTPPSLTGDQRVARPRLRRSHEHGLEHADLLHTRRQLGQRLFVEVKSWLMWVRG